MFQGKDIEELVKLLEAREASLFHACQFADFQSYLTIGGIPSRARLEADQQAFTAFETDESDRHKGVWDKVRTYAVERELGEDSALIHVQLRKS